MGFPIVEAIHDAEAQAAYLTQTNECFAVVSEDYDSLLFGAKNTIRKFSAESKEFELFNLEKILKELHIKREQLILIGILVGLDFFEGVKGIGPKKALELVKTYAKEQIFRKYNFNERIEEIYNYLLNPPINKDYTLSFSPPNEEKILSFLVDKYEFSEERVKNGLELLKEGYTKNFRQKTLF